MYIKNDAICSVSKEDNQNEVYIRAYKIINALLENYNKTKKFIIKTIEREVKELSILSTKLRDLAKEERS